MRPLPLRSPAGVISPHARCHTRVTRDSMFQPPPPPPPTEVEVVIVHAPRLAPLDGEAAFSAVQVGPEVLKTQPRRATAPRGAGGARGPWDGAPQNAPLGGWVIWSARPWGGLAGATIGRGGGAGPYGAGALTGTVALQERGTVDGLGLAEVSYG